MELKSLDNNWTNSIMELTAGSMTVLFSCGSPVACRNTNGEYYFLEHGGVTDHDETTSSTGHQQMKGRSQVCRNIDCHTITKHINTWLADVEAATPVAQDFFDDIVLARWSSRDVSTLMKVLCQVS